jgi:hypothetical protein
MPLIRVGIGSISMMTVHVSDDRGPISPITGSISSITMPITR